MAKTKDKKKSKKGKGGKGRKFDGSKAKGPKIFTGLNEDRMKTGGGKFAERVDLKQGDTALVQFLTGIDEFVEIDQHQFRDSGKWKYIPCGGEGCPMCEDEDEEVSKVHYRFFANVYDFEKKCVAILEGPKTLSNLIAQRFKKNKKEFTSRTWEISKMKTQPVTYDVDRGEKKPVSTKKLKLIDLVANIVEQYRWHMGGNADVSALTEEVDPGADAMDDVVWTKKKLDKLVKKDDDTKLIEIAVGLGIKKKKAKSMDLPDLAKAILKAQG